MNIVPLIISYVDFSFFLSITKVGWSGRVFTEQKENEQEKKIYIRFVTFLACKQFLNKKDSTS